MNAINWFVEVNKKQKYVVFYKHHKDLGDNFSVHDVEEAWEVDGYIVNREKGHFNIFHFLRSGKDQHTSKSWTPSRKCKCGKSMPESWLMFARLILSDI